MIKPIVKDVFFLGQKSEPATKQDLSVGQDLQEIINQVEAAKKRLVEVPVKYRKKEGIN